jgi:hypothetical protein
MKARQARKILRYYNGGKMHKLSRYWFTRLLFYKGRPPVLGDNDIMGWNDHRITKALKVYQRHGRCKHYLDL